MPQPAEKRDKESLRKRPFPCSAYHDKGKIVVRPKNGMDKT
jgi:hypothetical protein